MYRLPLSQIPYCSVFNPRNETEVLAGTSNKKIVQWDTRKPDDIMQEYNEHLGPVNTVCSLSRLHS